MKFPNDECKPFGQPTKPKIQTKLVLNGGPGFTWVMEAQEVLQLSKLSVEISRPKPSKRSEIITALATILKVG